MPIVNVRIFLQQYHTQSPTLLIRPHEVGRVAAAKTVCTVWNYNFFKSSRNATIKINYRKLYLVQLLTNKTATLVACITRMMTSATVLVSGHFDHRVYALLFSHSILGSVFSSYIAFYEGRSKSS